MLQHQIWLVFCSVSGTWLYRCRCENGQLQFNEVPDFSSCLVGPTRFIFGRGGGGFGDVSDGYIFAPCLDEWMWRIRGVVIDMGKWMYSKHSRFVGHHPMWTSGSEPRSPRMSSLRYSTAHSQTSSSVDAKMYRHDALPYREGLRHCILWYRHYYYLSLWSTVLLVYYSPRGQMEAALSPV